MIGRLLESIVARPRVYDMIQAAAGAEKVRWRVVGAVHHAVERGRVRSPGNEGVILDVGGGTGGWRGLWQDDSTYVCLDLDPQKLQGFRRRHPAGLAALADARRLPFGDASVDAIACTFLCHHFSEPDMDVMLGECARVLKPGHIFAFTDPLWEPRRWLGRILWRWDRGSFPRTADALREVITRHFEICHWEQFAVLHAYAICIATPRSVERRSDL